MDNAVRLGMESVSFESVDEMYNKITTGNFIKSEQRLLIFILTTRLIRM